MVKMFSRAGRAALFDRKAFTQAFFDDDATADGAIVVAAVGALTYLGMLLWDGRIGQFGLFDLLQSVIMGVIWWLIVALATWFAATRLFGASSRRPQTMMALHGLAVLPLLAGIVPGRIAAAVGLVWYLALLVVATREATDINPRNAGVSVLIGFALATLVRALMGVPFGLVSSLF